MAISPIHVIYAQESREYILWAVTILLCSASLLRAIRLESQEQKSEFFIFTWGIYAVTLALSLYTFLLSGFVAVADGIYVFANAKFRWNQTVKNYVIASLAAFLAFMPWLLVVIANFWSFNASTAWTKASLPLVNLIQSWLIQLSRIFWDFDFGFENPLSYLITPLFFILVGYSLYFLYRTTHQNSWLFIVTLIAVSAIPLMLPDLIFGGVRSQARSLFIAFLFRYSNFCCLSVSNSAIFWQFSTS